MVLKATESEGIFRFSHTALVFWLSFYEIINGVVVFQRVYYFKKKE